MERAYSLVDEQKAGSCEGCCFLIENTCGGPEGTPIHMEDVCNGAIFVLNEEDSQC